MLYIIVLSLNHATIRLLWVVSGGCMELECQILYLYWRRVALPDSQVGTVRVIASSRYHMTCIGTNVPWPGLSNVQSASGIQTHAWHVLCVHNCAILLPHVPKEKETGHGDKGSTPTIPNLSRLLLEALIDSWYPKPGCKELEADQLSNLIAMI